MQVRLTLLVAATWLCAGAASAQQLEVVYCEIPTSPKSVVPGALDNLTGNPEATNFRALEDLFVSPDGSTWMIKARTQQGSDEENIMLRGSGLTGTMFAQEGQPVHAGAPGEVYDFFGSGVGRFNSLNQFAYSARARGGVASVFQKVIFWNGTTFSIPTQMGDLYTGLIDQSPNPVGDETVGNSIGSIHLLDNGTIGAQDSTIGNIHSSKRPAIFYNRAMFKQVENTIVLDYAGTSNIQVDNLSANTFYTTPDGAHWIVEVDVDMSLSSRTAIVYDGAVKLEVNQVVPGSSVVVGDVFATNIAANGDWFARGRDNSGTATSAPDWAARNATLIAKTGDSIAGSEHYGDTFYAFTGNAVGDWVLCANTDNANALLNEVVVWDGNVVVREGDPVDVDGNGLFDDNAFIGRASTTTSVFQPNDFALTDDNVLYFFATLKDGSGADLGSNPVFGGPDVFLRIDLDGSCGVVSTYCTAGTTTNGCVTAISGSGTPSASAGAGFTITVANVEGLKSGLIFYGINGPNAAPWAAGSSSFLCVKPPTQRTPAQNSGGTLGACDGSLSLDFDAFLAAHPGALGQPFVGGETLWTQGWFRDPPAPKTTNLSNGLEFVLCP